MKIIAVDPGYERLGVAILERDDKTRKEKLLFSECFQTDKALPHPERLARVGAEILRVVELYQPEALAIETLFFSKNVKTALKLAHVRGVALLAIAEAQIALGEYSPLAIKVSVVGYGRAEKQQVQMMVRTLTGLQGVIETEDASDALAVAICHATTCRTALRANV